MPRKLKALESNLRSSPTKASPARVDKTAGEAGVVYGVSVMEKGRTRSKPFIIDDTTIDQTIEAGNRKTNGVKARMSHPDLCHDGIGTELARMQNFRKSDDGNRVLADMHMLSAARKSHEFAKDPVEWVLDMADENPDLFALSIAPSECDHVPFEDENGDGKVDENGDRIMLYRLNGLTGVDLVDEGAANNAGLFGDTPNLTHRGTILLDQALTAASSTGPVVSVDVDQVIELTAGLDLSILQAAGANLSDDAFNERAAEFLNQALNRRGVRHPTFTATDVSRAFAAALNSSAAEDQHMFFDKDGKPLDVSNLKEGDIVYVKDGAGELQPRQFQLSSIPKTDPSEPKKETSTATETGTATSTNDGNDGQLKADGNNLEFDRQKGIRDLCAMHASYDLATLQEQMLNDQNCTVENAVTRVSEHIKQVDEANGPGRMSVGDPSHMKIAGQMEAVLCHHHGLLDKTAWEDRGKELPEDLDEMLKTAKTSDLLRVGHSIKRMGMTYLRSLPGSGNVDLMGEQEIYDRLFNLSTQFAHSSSSFPLLLANVANKSIIKGYDTAMTTWERWVLSGTLTDFKIAKRLRVSEAPLLVENPEGVPAVEGTFGEQQEEISIVRFARAISYTYEMWRNDDLAFFLRLGAMLGNAANLTVENRVYSVWTSNSGTGPVLNADSKALFHADHTNLNEGGVGTPNQARLKAALAAMHKQTGIGEDGEDIALGVTPRYALAGVSPAQELDTIIGSPFIAGDAAHQKQLRVIRNLELIEVPYLSLKYPNQWDLVADQNSFPSMEVAFLDGVNRPEITTKEGHTVDGVRVVIKLYGNAAYTGGFEAVQRNAGA